MRVSVKLFATLAQNPSQALLAQYPQGIRSGHPLEVDLPEDSTLADLAAQLDLPRQEIKVTFVNGRARPLDYRLQVGDQVGIFPPIGGG